MAKIKSASKRPRLKFKVELKGVDELIAQMKEATKASEKFSKMMGLTKNGTLKKWWDRFHCVDGNKTRRGGGKISRINSTRELSGRDLREDESGL